MLPCELNHPSLADEGRPSRNLTLNFQLRPHQGQPRGSSSTRGSNPSGSRGGSSANRGGRGGGASGAGGERQKKEAILNLQKYQDKEVRVKFQGGREGEFDAWVCFRPGIWSVCSCGGDDSNARKYCQAGGTGRKTDRQMDMEFQAGGRRCRVGRAAQNDRARLTGSICGSQAEELQPRPGRERTRRRMKT